MNNGWIKIHRQMKEHWLWKDKPFSKAQAWFDILMRANHRKTKVNIGNRLVEIECGSFITSELKLMKDWGWSKSKTRAFLKLLENDQMIVKKPDTKKTTIKVLKYNEYQTSETTKELQTDRKPTASRLQKDTDNNDKNVKNEKNIKKKDIKKKFGIYNNVLFSEKELVSLKEKFPNSWQKKIATLDEGIEMHGYKYKSHYLAILSWARKDGQKSSAAARPAISEQQMKEDAYRKKMESYVPTAKQKKNIARMKKMITEKYNLTTHE